MSDSRSKHGVRCVLEKIDNGNAVEALAVLEVLAQDLRAHAA
jgi:hypothetical protein